MLNGMDIERVTALTAHLDRQSAAIAAVVAVVDGSVQALTEVWFGENLNAFHASWVGGQRAAAHAAAGDVAAAVRELREQLDQQRAASGERAGVSGGGNLGEAGLIGGILGAAEHVASAAHHLLQGAATLGGNRFSMGRYPKVWNGLRDRVHAFGEARGWGSVDDHLMYKRWPVLHLLNRHEDLLRGLEHGTDHLAAGLAVVSASSEVVADLRHHDVHDAVFDGLSGATNLIRKSGAGWVAGVWVEVGRAATNNQIDYSWKGLHDITSASAQDWGHAIVEGIQSPEGTKAVNTITFGLPNLLAKWIR